MRIKSLGLEGEGFVVFQKEEIKNLPNYSDMEILKVSYPDRESNYSLNSADTLQLEVTDITRKEFQALRNAGFSLILQKEVKV